MGLCVKTAWLTPTPDVNQKSLVATSHDDWERGGQARPGERLSQAGLSEIAGEILEHLRQTHRRPGARLSVRELTDGFGTDPAIATALSELTDLKYVEHPDAHTIELTPRGFDAAHRPHTG